MFARKCIWIPPELQVPLEPVNEFATPQPTQTHFNDLMHMVKVNNLFRLKPITLKSLEAEGHRVRFSKLLRLKLMMLKSLEAKGGKKEINRHFVVVEEGPE